MADKSDGFAGRNSMTEISAMHSSGPSSGILAVRDQRMQIMTGIVASGDSVCLVTSGAERLGYLLRLAIQLIESDVKAASRCLRDASTLLGAESLHPAGNVLEIPRFQSGGLARWQAKQAVDHIEENLGSKIRTGELANMFSLSKSHFSRVFKRTFGVSPTTYLVMRRVERAKSLMTSTSEKLPAIAVSCGFADQSHLNRVFHRLVGMTPGLWRRTATVVAGATGGDPMVSQDLMVRRRATVTEPTARSGPIFR
jgi:AraC family transcriptional regulator